jgi:cell division protein FtsL
MATVSATLPRTPRRPRNRPAAGRGFPDLYVVKRIDNSRLRREVDPAKRGECLTLLGLGVVVFLFLLVFAWQHFQCVQYGYQIEQLKSQRASLEQWNHELRLEHAALTDPMRIDTLARQELGLVMPAPQQVIPLEGSVVARNMAAPGTAPGALSRGQ